MKLRNSIEPLFNLVIDMTLAVAVKDVVKFSGYSPENINGNSKPCFEYPSNCIQSCMLNALCTAFASHHEAARCDSFLLVFYRRVILKSNRNSTTWVKGIFRKYFLMFD